jgi:hypothetical protein
MVTIDSGRRRLLPARGPRRPAGGHFVPVCVPLRPLRPLFPARAAMRESARIGKPAR